MLGMSVKQIPKLIRDGLLGRVEGQYLSLSRTQVEEQSPNPRPTDYQFRAFGMASVSEWNAKVPGPKSLHGRVLSIRLGNFSRACNFETFTISDRLRENCSQPNQ